MCRIHTLEMLNEWRGSYWRWSRSHGRTCWDDSHLGQNMGSCSNMTTMTGSVDWMHVNWVVCCSCLVTGVRSRNWLLLLHQYYWLRSSRKSWMVLVHWMAHGLTVRVMPCCLKRVLTKSTTTWIHDCSWCRWLRMTTMWSRHLVYWRWWRVYNRCLRLGWMVVRMLALLEWVRSTSCRMGCSRVGRHLK